MKIVLSERVEAELEHHFAYGIRNFGHRVAERTFARVRRFLFESLAAHPSTGVYRSEREVYEAVIPRTPFVVFYRIDPLADTLTAVAFFHHAQDRHAEGATKRGDFSMPPLSSMVPCHLVVSQPVRKKVRALWVTQGREFKLSNP